MKVVQPPLEYVIPRIILLCLIALIPIQVVYAYPNVHVRVSVTGQDLENNAKLWVELQDGREKKRTIDIGKEANKQDENELDFYFNFKGNARKGEYVKACLDIKNDGFKKDCDKERQLSNKENRNKLVFVGVETPSYKQSKN